MYASTVKFLPKESNAMSDANEHGNDGAKSLPGEKLIQSRIERYGEPYQSWNDWGKTWENDPNWDRVVYDRES